VGDRAVASLGDDDFGAALGAAVSFTYLICHGMHPFIEFTLYYMPAAPLLSKLDKGGEVRKVTELSCL
jgi:hypothetical protein